MAQLIRIIDNRGGYLQLVDFVRTRGVKQESRNGPTLEVNDMVIELQDPTKAVPCGIGRRGYSLALGLLEGLQLVAGATYDDLMVKVAPSTDAFREEDGRFHGGYGRRIAEQMPLVVERLKQDLDTRQAVVTLWNPDLDARGGKKDHPCTCLFNWRVRDGHLFMSTFMRSQDVHWGWPYDVVMFATLQLTLASYLGVRVGTYVHHAASFHIYTKDLPALNSLTQWDGVDTRLQPLDAAGEPTWQSVMDWAEALLAGLEEGETSESLSLTGTSKPLYDAIRAKVGP